MPQMQLAPFFETTSALASESQLHTALLFGARVLVGSLFVALCSHLAFPIPFTPVPFTMQPFAVLLVGMLFGPWTGFVTLLVYLCEGASGLPVFTPMGLPGIARLMGPTGGYLMSYPLAAAVAGSVRRLRAGTYLQHLGLGAVALFVVYACGSLWLAHGLHVPFAATLSAAVLPFAAPDVIKLCAAAGVAIAFRRGTERS